MDDVPSPIDFHDRSQALAWIERTERERPYRPRFFRRMTDELVGMGRPLSVLELGSGPGVLARHILDACPRVTSYTLLDFSEAMLEISRERIGEGVSRAVFLQRDFRTEAWAQGLGSFDVVVSLQAVHELRHKRRAPALFRQVAALLRPGGLALICDHLPGPSPDASRAALLMTVEEQRAALQAAGLSVEVLLESDGMALFRAVPGVLASSSTVPTLATERLIVRPLRASDAEPISRLAGDPRVAEPIPDLSHPYPIERAVAWIASQERMLRDRRCIHFGIEEMAGRELVGGFSLGVDRSQPSNQIGYWIGVPYWGRGYATEAGREVLRYAFTTLALPCLHALFLERNPASGAVLRKLGMQRFEREMENHRGRHEPHVRCSLRRDDFQARD